MTTPFETLLAEAAAGSDALAVGAFSLDGRVLEANGAMLEVLGAALGDPVADHFRAPLFSALASATEGTVAFEGLLTLGDEKAPGFSLQARVRVADQRVLVVAEHDVAEQQRLAASMIELNHHANNLQRELIKERRRLVELNQQKDRFLGIAAHDLRNPLGAILGYAKLLQSGVLDDETGQAALVSVEMASNKMLILVEDLVTLATLERGSIDLLLDDVNLSAFLERVEALNRPLATRKDIALSFTIEGVRAWRFDERRIERVLDNLLSNAFKFSNPGTRVDLLVRRRGMYLELLVTDQGQGIPADQVDGMFDEYARTDTAPTGGEPSSGLGLAICRHLVDLHGGTIDVQSELGVGSTFRVRLPPGAAA